MESAPLHTRHRCAFANLLAAKICQKISRFCHLFHYNTKQHSHHASALKANQIPAIQPQVKRLSSWSRYLETPGGEQAVESAEEWMVDMSQLFLGHRFASGAYSRLYHGIYQQKVVAVKVMKQSDDDNVVATRLDYQFSREVSLLSRLHHNNIVEFVAACRKPPVFCVITEYLPGGSLRTFLNKNEPQSLSPEFVLRSALDVSRGMDYLHSQGVIHRDLKSENLLLTGDLHVKVADFGVSCLESQWDSMKGYNGTYRWMAPEMINEKPYGRKVDVYSFGIVLWELLTGLIPHAEMTGVQAAFAVSQKNVRPAIPPGCPVALSKLMQQCWSTNPERRPEFGQIVKILEHIESALKQKTVFGSKQEFPKRVSFLGCFTTSWHRDVNANLMMQKAGCQS